jgi:polysaccharide biosynthesis transport protein
MQFYTQILKHYWRLLAATTVLGVIAAYFVTAFVIVPMYTARAQLFVGTTSDSRDSAGLNQSGQFAQQRVKTYAELITTPRVLDPVIANLGLGISASEFASRVTAAAPLNTVLITVEVTDQSPRIAEAAANLIVEQFALLAPQLETSDTEQRAPVRVSVAAPATVPIRPNGQRRSTYLVLGALTGLALGAGLVLLWEAWRPRYRNDEDLSQSTELPVLAHLGRSELALSSKRRRASSADSFKLIRNRLDVLGEQHELQSVLAVPAHVRGHTPTFSLNLARSYAAAGQKVALVDGDLSERRLSAAILNEPMAGLPEVLTGELPVGAALVATGYDGVSLLSSGLKSLAPMELSVNSSLQGLMADLEGMADVVIIDGPAPLENADALVWGRVASATVVLVDDGGLQSVVDKSVALLRASQAKFVGAIFVPRRTPLASSS